MMTNQSKSVRRTIALCAGVMLGLLLIHEGRASAEVADSAANGFTLRETAHIAAPSDKVYAALVAPQNWWSSGHTFSGSAANMRLEAKAGGCWCEDLPDGGSVLHMTVVYAAPGKALRLRGALGPFQAMAADGAMTWSLTGTGGGTDVVLTYALSGYAKDGFDRIAHAADGVLAEQVARLKAFAETAAQSPQ